MAWWSSRYKWERDRRREMVPKDTIIGHLTVTLPAELKVWLENESYRRDIPTSWLATEIVKLGTEAYELIGPPRPEATKLDSIGRQSHPRKKREHTLGDGPSGWSRYDDED